MAEMNDLVRELSFKTYPAEFGIGLGGSACRRLYLFAWPVNGLQIRRRPQPLFRA
jgi:hypothetical protein